MAKGSQSIRATGGTQLAPPPQAAPASAGTIQVCDVCNLVFGRAEARATVDGNVVHLQCVSRLLPA